MAVPRILAAICLISFGGACAITRQPPAEFLHAIDKTSDQWLNTTVDVDLAEVRLVHLPLTDAFTGMKISFAKADAPLENLKMSLHASHLTRREALWLLSRRYGLVMTIQEIPGRLPYIAISQE